MLESLDAEFEFVASIARPLPTLVITELLGVDPAMHGDFKIWSDRIIADKLNPLADEETRAEVERRRHTGERPEDLLSGMIEARVEDIEPYSPFEISQHAQLLRLAGNQMTTDLMGAMVKNPLETDSWRALVEEPALIRTAIEESLRFEPPIFSTERFAPETMQIEGETIPKGHMIAAMLTAQTMIRRSMRAPTCSTFAAPI